MIFMLGDVRGDISHLWAVVEAGRPVAIIFLGDIKVPTNLDDFLGDLMTMTEVWWIPGNHDADSKDNTASSMSRHLPTATCMVAW